MRPGGLSGSRERQQITPRRALFQIKQTKDPLHYSLLASDRSRARCHLAALDKARAAAAAAKKYGEIPRFPATAHDQIHATFAKANEPLLAGAGLFDVFADPTGAKVPAAKKSVAYSLTCRTAGRTLTAHEVNAANECLKQRLTAEFGITLRA